MSSLTVRERAFLLLSKMTPERKIKYPVVYEPQTTYADSYRKYENLKRSENTTTRDRFESPPKSKSPPKVRDNETLYYYRQDSKVPFNLLWEKKPIIQTNPYECFNIPVRPQRFNYLVT